MAFRILRPAGIAVLLTASLVGISTAANGQQRGSHWRQFPLGAVLRAEDLPTGRLRARIERLPASARDRAITALRNFHFTELDLETLDVDGDGGIFYVDTFSLAPNEVGAASEPGVAEASVPVSPFPASLIFHSRPGAPNVLFLNFSGKTVTNTAWNNSLSRTNIPAVAFSTDSDFSTFSDAEQLAIKRIWQRVREDFAPFDVDVTTERPATFGPRTGEALITRNTDSNGDPNPSSSAGGVAYVNVFGGSSYSNFRPAWIYFNNLGNSESHVSEAASHELGHNMGLSHDGLTNGTSYYSGHGSGDTSWGPIMGTGYNRNLSQWSEGEYYMANNTQDDLSIIAGKLSYRSDDHGDTRTTATALNLTGGTNIVSTTPETDPTNSDPSNKGIIERSTDVDVFSFVTGAGQIRVTVNPWIGPSGTKGGNLDLLLELYDANGTLLTTTNPPNQTIAQIQTTVAEGRYFLQVRNTGAGDPFGSTPTGYTSYASIGQYFISGYLQPSTFVAPPIAEAQPVNVTLPDVGANQFTVTYSDDLAVDASTIDGNDIRITGPNSYDRLARLVSIDSLSSGTPRVATYAVDPPSATAWMPADNGIYTVWMRSNEVRDSQGVAVAGNSLGQFTVNVPTAFYSADMNTDPGWTLEPLWQYGPPAYPGTGPVSGFSGANIIAYNLSGTYQNNLSTKYATTPLIDCSGRSNLVLRFQRWLRLRSNDTALIQVTTNGSTWADVWSTTQTVSDNAWLLTQYALPSWVSGSAAVQLRWGISSGGSQNDIGWNLDDVQLLGLGSPATIPSVVLTVDVNNPNWGTVDPGGGTFQRGTSVQISATPAPYFRFVGWMGDTFSSSNPLGVVLNTDISVQAVFEELVTTNHSIPYWWLASHGRTNDFNNAELLNGANGIPVWESYVAGLDPNDPESQLRLTMRLSLDGANVVLNWNTVTGRVYTVYSSTNLGQGFLPLPSGADLPATMASFTNDCSTPSVTLYRVGVRKP